MPETESKLRVLHEEFVAAVNEAVAEDRDDLVDELVAEYPEAAAAGRGRGRGQGRADRPSGLTEDVAGRDLRARQLHARRRSRPRRRPPRSRPRSAPSRSRWPAARGPPAPEPRPQRDRPAPSRPPRPGPATSAGRERHPGLAVHDELAQPARRRRDQRCARGRRLQRDDPERLVAARQHHRVDGREQRGQLGVGQVPEEPDTAQHPVRPRAVLQHGPLGARARHQQAGCPGGRAGSGACAAIRSWQPFSYSSRPR